MTNKQLRTATHLTQGAASFDQMIAKLERMITILRELQSAGVTLTNPVDGGHAVSVTDKPHTASTLGCAADDDAPAPKKSASQRRSSLAKDQKPRTHPKKSGSRPRR